MELDKFESALDKNYKLISMLNDRIKQLARSLLNMIIGMGVILFVQLTIIIWMVYR